MPTPWTPQSGKKLESDKSSVPAGGVVVITGPANATVIVTVDGKAGETKQKLDGSGKLSLELQGPARGVTIILESDPENSVSIRVVEASNP